MKALAAAVCGLTLALTCLAAAAQAPTRIRGTIEQFDGKVLAVKTRDGGSVKVTVVDRTQIVYTQPIRLADIKAGDFLGITSTKGEDGGLTAFEVRRFPKPVNPGHRPFDGRSDQTMTNAAVSAVVQSASARELTVSYEGGTQKIVVPENAAVSMLVPGEHAQLRAGAPVSLTAAPLDGSPLVARRIQVGPPR